MTNAADAQRPKVFCIGYHKTGTTSVERALRKLDYRVANWQVLKGVADPASHRERLIHEVVAAHDAFADSPWFALYEALAAAWPGSRFILTTRPLRPWMASVRRHFGAETTPLREWLYGPGRGNFVGNEAHWIHRYLSHSAAVRHHFRDRPGDLLEIDVTQGDGYPQLCPFLGVPPIEGPFPHLNRGAGSSETRLRAALRRVPGLRRAVRAARTLTAAR